jgi:hypothetical protein
MQTVQLIRAFESALSLIWISALALAIYLAAWRAKLRARQRVQPRYAVAMARRPTRVFNSRRR